VLAPNLDLEPSFASRAGRAVFRDPVWKSRDLADEAAFCIASHWPAPRRRKAPVGFRVSVVVAMLILTGCNANQDFDRSSRAAPGVVAGPDYNPYNPISYAQNNSGNRSGGR
jgi:hypothetical protein